MKKLTFLFLVMGLALLSLAMRGQPSGERPEAAQKFVTYQVYKVVRAFRSEAVAWSPAIPLQRGQLVTLGTATEYGGVAYVPVSLFSCYRMDGRTKPLLVQKNYLLYLARASVRCRE